MVVVAKTQCKNNDDFYFSGKEMSPLGLGYCADSESVGYQMIGRDGKMWLVSVKNGEKAWVRCPDKIGLEKDIPLATQKKAPQTTSPVEEDSVKKPAKEKTKTKRGPTKYNLFIGRTLNQLRQEETGLPTIVYMQRALAIWKNLTPEEKMNLA